MVCWKVLKGSTSLLFITKGKVCLLNFKRLVMHKRLISLLFLIAILSTFSVNTTLAEEASEHSYAHKHDGAVFLGNTQDGSNNGSSLGVVYHYRFHQNFSIGSFLEYAGGDFEHWVLGVPLNIYPHKGWILQLAPGIEYEDEDNHSEFLVRTGIGYAFKIDDKYAITPEFNIDFVNGDTTFVYGVSLGMGF